MLDLNQRPLLVRDNTVCSGCLLLFQNTCRSAFFSSATILCVHRCSRALSSNCRQIKVHEGNRDCSRVEAIALALLYALVAAPPLPGGRAKIAAEEIAKRGRDALMFAATSRVGLDLPSCQG